MSGHPRVPVVGSTDSGHSHGAWSVCVRRGFACEHGRGPFFAWRNGADAAGVWWAMTPSRACRTMRRQEARRPTCRSRSHIDSPMAVDLSAPNALEHDRLRTRTAGIALAPQHLRAQPTERWRRRPRPPHERTNLSRLAPQRDQRRRTRCGGRQARTEPGWPRRDRALGPTGLEHATAPAH